MTDIATLGLAIDSSQVKTASTALDGLTAAANKAGPAAAALQKAVGGVSSSSGAATTASAALAAATTKAAAAHGGMSTQAMSAQHAIRSMVEGMAMGMPVTQILGQQLNHLSYAASGPGGLTGAFKTALGSITGLLSPTTLLVGGLAAVAGAAYLVYSAIKNTEIGFGNLSERTMTAVQSLHALESAAAFKGVKTADFLKDMEKFGTLTSEAKDKIGSLGELFRANNVQVGTLEQNFERAADLIKNARDEADKYRIIQSLGLPPTREWVQLLSQGSEGIRRARAEAVAFGDAADEGLIRRARTFDEAWDRALKNFSTGAKSITVDVIDKFDKIAEYANTSKGKLALALILAASGNASLLGSVIGGAIASGASVAPPAVLPFGAALGKGGIGSDASFGLKPPTINPEAQKTAIGLDQQHIGILGQLATVSDIVRQKENEISLARLAGVNITKSESDRILKLASDMALGTFQIRQQTEAEKINAGVIGLGVGATMAFRAEQERLADFRLRGIKLTDDQAAALKREAAALGAAAQAAAELKAKSDLAFATSQFGRSDTEAAVASQLRNIYGDDYKDHMNDAIAGQIRLNETLKEMKPLGENAMSGFLQDLRDGKTATDALHNVLTKLENKLFDIASNQVMSAVLKSATGSLSGLFGGSGDVLPGGAALGQGGIGHQHGGGIVGSEATFTKYVHPAYFDDAPRFHSGGMIGMNEVPIVAKRGEGVFTPAQMAALAPVGSGAPVVNIYNAPPGTQVSQSKTPSGAPQIDVKIMTRLIDDTIAGGLRGGQSATHAAIAERFGVTPKL